MQVREGANAIFFITWSRVFTVSMGVVTTEEQAPATIPAEA